ncbi:hypothetical protein QCA50_008137 [Cerrena zonata]|uniref:Uncharacterized protein n=1 Tax=Cerrena zonata TaxID=2478898 RepID=A0AAW0GF37_9APHY
MVIFGLMKTFSRTRRCTDASLDVCFFASAFTRTIFHPDSPSFEWERRLGVDTDISGEMSPVGSRPGSGLSRFAQ